MGSINPYNIKINSQNEEIEAVKYLDHTAITPQELEQLFYQTKSSLERQDYKKAEELLQLLVQIEPNNNSYLTALALSQKKNGQFEESLQSYHRSLECDDNNIETYFNLGILYHELNELDDAQVCYENALRINPEFYLAYYNLGNLFRQKKEFLSAMECYTKVIALNPLYEEAYYNCGVVSEHMNELSEALKFYNKTISLNSSHVEAHWNRSLIWLSQGKYEMGWSEYEWRIKRKDFRVVENKNKRWNGESLFRKKLLIYDEQGIGDVIQFSRYIKDVKEKGAYILFECRESLFNLFENAEYIDELFKRGSVSNDIYDFEIPLLSLPYVLGVNPNKNPQNSSYLFPTENMVKKWEEKLKNEDCFKIGIVWQGNPNHTFDYRRSCDSTLFESIAEIDGLKLYSLQRSNRLYYPAFSEGDKFIDLGVELNELGGVISNLDLVITVDTSIAHLAGAIGSNVWTLLSYNPDWRWGEAGETTSWYPTMKLYRQNKPGDWENVFSRVKEDILMILSEWNSDPRRNSEIKAARELLRSGNTSEALEKLRMLDNVYKANSEIKCWLGTALYILGDGNEAVKFLDEAIRLDSANESAFNNLGLVYMSFQEYENASLYFLKTLEINAHNQKAMNNLAICYYNLDDYIQAEELLLDSLTINPDDAETYYNLGLIKHKKSDFENAEKYYLKVLEINTSHQDTLMNLGLVKQKNGYFEEAEQYLLKAAESNNNFLAYFHLGNLAKETEAFEKACDFYSQAIIINKDFLDAYINLGNTHYLAGKPDTALAIFKELENRSISTPKIMFNIAITLLELGDMEQAEKYFKKAIKTEKKNPDFHLGLAEVLLLKNDFAAGWEEYEWRLKRGEYKNSKYISILGKKRKLSGKRILVHDEQGIGDCLQFARYLLLLQSDGASVYLDCREELKDLMAYNFTLHENSSITDFDYNLYMLSLPKFYKTDLSNIPSGANYINVDPLLIDEWNKKIAVSQNYKIGIFWAGKKYPVHNRKRHCRFSDFYPISQIKDIDIISLQVGEQVKELKDSPHEFYVKDYSDEIRNINDTAAIIKNLDLVISVDSAIAHLAGALGKPVWTLLHYIPDWRWGLTGETSPWYPGMKLFRQKSRGDWNGVFKELLEKLKYMLD